MARYAVGLTGGIASGKSAAAEAFAALGVDVVDADVLAREVVAPGSEGLHALMAAFDSGILDADGALDRRRMRERVFGDPAARSRLEGIVHPRVRALLRERLDTAASPYAIAAIPLLAEGGGRQAYPSLDRILVIDVDPATQHARAMARDGIDAELASRMIAAQATRAQRFAVADDVVVNDATLAALHRHVRALDRRYRAWAALAARSEADASA